METDQVVSAHRLLLAGASPVFRKLFFGSIKNTEDVVEIKEAFKTMINYIYTSPEAPCDVLNLAETYEILAVLGFELSPDAESLVLGNHDEGDMERGGCQRTDRC